MAKRRTRKQKEFAKHPVTISWKPSSSASGSEAKKTSFEPNVKRQIQKYPKPEKLKSLRTQNSDYTGKISNLASIKKDVARSLILALIILASEVVLYLLW